MAVASCTPAARLSTLSCLACLSESELDKAFVVALAASGATYTLPGDAGQLIEDSACFTCLTKKQLKQALVSAYAEDQGLTVAQIRARLRCLQCATPKQIDAATVYLTCVLIR
jgi:hypothetical protein